MMERMGKDFWSGIMFLCFAGGGVYASRSYGMGSSGEMGPRAFPLLLGLLLGAIGLFLVARALLDGDQRVDGRDLRPLVFVVVGVVLFGLCIEPLGLIVTIGVTVVTVAMAGRGAKPAEIALLSAGLAALSAGIFHFALRLPLPLWPAV